MARDKQPETTGWADGLGPWKPVMRGDRLYGRGGADDGYSTFAALAALRVLADQRVRHARCIVLIEACEESGSNDLPHYIEHLADRIGKPSLVVCLDSGAGDYERLWCTTSLRGLVNGNLYVDVLREGVHSGEASGIVPSSFRILRMLLGRLEDEQTGRIRPEWLYPEIPAQRVEQTRAMAHLLGDAVWDHFSWRPGAQPITNDPVELLLNRAIFAVGSMEREEYDVRAGRQGPIHRFRIQFLNVVSERTQCLRHGFSGLQRHLALGARPAQHHRDVQPFRSQFNRR